MMAYWAKQRRKALLVLEGRDYSSWFNLWHTHPDWKSRGNRSLEDRAAVAAITCELLGRAEQLGAHRQDSLQVFAMICEDTGSNAIYLHSENPYGIPFPYQFENTEWNVACPPELAGLVDPSSYQVGKTQANDYVIRKRT